MEFEPPFEVCEWRVVLRLVRCVANEGQDHGGGNECFEMWEVIAKLVVGLQREIEQLEKVVDLTYQAVWLLVSHGVDNDEGGADEKDFHDRVVDGDEVPKDVHVAQQEHSQVHFLRFARQTYRNNRWLANAMTSIRAGHSF